MPVGDETFGELLRRRREAAGLTRDELAEAAGLSPNAIGALERGERRRPYPHTVRALADALGLVGADQAAFFAAVRRRVDVPRAEVSPPVATAAGAGAAVVSPVPTALIAREQETAVGVSLLSRPEVRLLTLTGPGGVGKTRLALRLAEECRDVFPHGVTVVSLAPVRQAADVAGAIALALDARSAAGADPWRHLVAALGEKRFLLVLDNVEHVAEAASELVPLLAACPGLKILATSRTPLRVRGEQEYRVPPLEAPGEQMSDPLTLGRNPAVRLFVARAQAVQPGFALTTANAGAIAAICRQLDGLPLAIELAAARIELLPPAAMLLRLDRSIHLLSGGARDLPARQQTMHNAITWSYDLLDDEARRLFSRLAVFSGGWSLSAAEAICGEEVDGFGVILDQLGTLLQSNMIYRVAGDDGEEPRYAMLETMRAYAWERLEASGEATLRTRRHAAYFRAFVSDGAPHLTGPDQQDWLRRFDLDRHNGRVAISTLMEHDVDAAVEMVWWLWRYWWVRGLQRVARRLMEEALRSAPQLSDQRRAEALLLIGSMAWSEGDAAYAVRSLKEGLELSRATGNARGQAIGHLILGLGLIDAGAEVEQRAQAHFEASLALFRAIGERWGEAFALSYQGLIPLLGGNIEDATACFDESLTVARAAEDGVAAHQALYSLALAAQTKGNLERAAAAFGEGLTLAMGLGDIVNAGYFVRGIAQIAGECGRAAEALRLLGAASAALEATGSPPYRYLNTEELELRLLATANEELGEALASEAWQAGRALPLEASSRAAITLAEELAGSLQAT